MAESCAHIEALNKKAKYIKHKYSEGNILAASPESNKKLSAKNGYFKALTKVQLRALLFSKYQTMEEDSGPKLALVEFLKSKIADNPRSLDAAPPTTATITP